MMINWPRIFGALILIGALYLLFTDPVGAAHATRSAFHTVGVGFDRFLTFLGAL